MQTIVRAGVVLGVLVVVWTFVMGFTGWYKDPALLNLFYVVIPIQIGVLVWALRQTAAQGRRYGSQVGAGTLISLIGGVIIIAGSILFTTVVFPNYFSELAAIQERMLQQAGHGEAEIREVMAMTAKTATPVFQAVFGFVGTMVTGVVASLAIGAFARAR
ncbi:MAG: hypothetical protein A2W00_15185 [Candidatus Eisenbacteria bacterium RBG_16_71_46]|nr:MAG: hypothetical protein A2W00_15185 [Candidatus Eisenbacteria bacterium RBG_16_71_46]OGF24318.1 MAG: hypothetical protein A2V63_06860 [Candidatus Eisenbacteria bacterium RBG_19FT_COMBO_70_11]